MRKCCQDPTPNSCKEDMHLHSILPGRPIDSIFTISLHCCCPLSFILLTRLQMISLNKTGQTPNSLVSVAVDFSSVDFINILSLHCTSLSYNLQPYAFALILAEIFAFHFFFWWITFIIDSLDFFCTSSPHNLSLYLFSDENQELHSNAKSDSNNLTPWAWTAEAFMFSASSISTKSEERAAQLCLCWAKFN